MDVTIIFLKYLGVFYVIFGIALLLNKKMINTLMTIMRDDGKLFFLAFITIMFSLPIVLFHNIWDSYLAGFVSFIGWAGLLKGFLQMAFPDYIRSKAESSLNPKNFKIRSVLALVFGLFCLYFAYKPSCLI